MFIMVLAIQTEDQKDKEIQDTVDKTIKTFKSMSEQLKLALATSGK